MMKITYVRTNRTACCHRCPAQVPMRVFRRRGMGGRSGDGTDGFGTNPFGFASEREFFARRSRFLTIIYTVSQHGNFMRKIFKRTTNETDIVTRITYKYDACGSYSRENLWEYWGPRLKRTRPRTSRGLGGTYLPPRKMFLKSFKCISIKQNNEPRNFFIPPFSKQFYWIFTIEDTQSIIVPLES